MISIEEYIKLLKSGEDFGYFAVNLPDRTKPDCDNCPLRRVRPEDCEGAIVSCYRL